MLTILIGSPFPWKNIWRIKVPSRVAIFVWMAALGKILTLDNPRKRNIIMVDWYCTYKMSEESIDHLLFHCEGARDLWSLSSNLFGIVWVMPKRVRGLLVSLGGRQDIATS